MLSINTKHLLIGHKTLDSPWALIVFFAGCSITICPLEGDHFLEENILELKVKTIS